MSHVNSRAGHHRAPDRLLRLRDVTEITGVSRATIYREIESGKFPKPVKLGSASCWSSFEVGHYIEERKAARRTNDVPLQNVSKSGFPLAGRGGLQK